MLLIISLRSRLAVEVVFIFIYGLEIHSVFGVCLGDLLQDLIKEVLVLFLLRRVNLSELCTIFLRILLNFLALLLVVFLLFIEGCDPFLLGLLLGAGISGGRELQTLSVVVIDVLLGMICKNLSAAVCPKGPFRVLRSILLKVVLFF